MTQPLAVYSVSLGCPKNRVDTEKFLGSLGIPLKICAEASKSQLVFINTCAFIEPAVRESIREILDSVKNITVSSKPLIVVGGCLPGRYAIEELKKGLPEVDIWLTPENIEKWPRIICNALRYYESTFPGRLLSTGPAYAWLKIGDGCNHKCSFCTIPAIRGKLSSFPAKDILNEAHDLVQQGVKELVLVGQDTGAWGKDIKSETGGLSELLEKLAAIPKLEWLRILYLYPDAITEDLLKAFNDIGSPLLPYFDIPLQHSEIAILEKMGRPLISPYSVIEKIRKHISNSALRTSLIVGFPGETEADFRNLARFIETVKFQNLGVFTYYPEEGTKAASLPNQISEEVKEERKAILMEIQARISAELLSENVGSTMKVLVESSLEEEWPGLYKGRVWFQAPEIDGITYVSGAGVTPGAFLPCEIASSMVYDLSALSTN